MNDAHQPKLEAPQLRTLLLTDLCDSTALVEKIGDNAAAELFRDHDHLVLTLQREWRGRLIDRSDGLLLLFERPIDGLGFALDYTHGLQDLGQARKLKLQARAGLHVGEVLTWRNSEEAISIGAKPLEVEGLAKPMAARLMTLARPGQILLSAVAESLTHRAARELGDRGQRLLWKSHGRWRFKGVPTAQEIYEVGEIGLTPLRSPKGSAKAWRDLPLWRRPAALVAEVALVAAATGALWFFGRPQPAIAFAERDWVVVTDLQNRTDNPLFDDSLEQAFLISLQQSNYVNVVSSIKVRDTLQRMNRDASVHLDRKLGTEVAIRDGARAVLVPLATEVGGKLRVAVDVIDPTTGSTVLTISKDGTGTASALRLVDAVTASLRDKLGETLESINHTSSPLPQVTTSSLDALKAYAMGQKAQDMRQFDRALAYYQQAIELDAEFALAHMGMAICYEMLVNTKMAQSKLEDALRLQSHLPKRDQLYLQSWKSRFDGDSSAAMQRLRMLIQLYPDYYDAIVQYVWVVLAHGDYAEAEKYSKPALTPQNPGRSTLLSYLGRAQLGLGKVNEALISFQDAELARGGKNGSLSAIAIAAAGDPAKADELLTQAATGRPMTNGEAVTKIDLMLQQGRRDLVDALVDERLGFYSDMKKFMPRLFRFIRLSVHVRGAQDDPIQSLRDFIAESQGEVVHGLSGDREDNAYLLLASYYLLQRTHPELAKRSWSEKIISQAAVSKSPSVVALSRTVQAKQSLIEGDAQQALRLLENDPGSPALLQAALVRRDAYLALGRQADAELSRKAIAAALPAAYADVTGSYSLQPLNVADVIESGDSAEQVARR